MSDELTVKGIILSTAPQGEYGRRIRMLTDKLGRITVFAGGAAKASSKLIGMIRPMTCAVFKIAKGREAYNLHGAELIDAFDDIAFDFEASVYAMYVLEAGDYFSEEGMPEQEAKSLLNLMYVSLSALREKLLPEELIASIYELRLLVLQGEYTLMPSYYKSEETVEIWQRCISAPLKQLYKADYFRELDTDEFMSNAKLLFDRQVKHSFRTLDVLKKL